MKNKKPCTAIAQGFYSLAAELGFEPRQTAPEAVVLPLHNSAKSTRALVFASRKDITTFSNGLQDSFSGIFIKKAAEQAVLLERDARRCLVVD